MIKLLFATLLTLVLFTTSASADHVYYQTNQPYRDSGVIVCQSENASLKVIRKMVTIRRLSYSNARRIAERYNCTFKRNPVSFVINEFICYSIRTDDKKAFTLTKSFLVETSDIAELFMILHSKSDTPTCKEYDEGKI